MKTDKNTVIGFVLIGMLFIGYFWMIGKEKQTLALEAQKMHADSLAKGLVPTPPKFDSAAAVLDSLKIDSANNLAKAGDFETAANAPEQLTKIDNGIIKIVFSNKGGQPRKVELKKYKSYDSTNVVMAGTPFDNLSYSINTGNNQSAATSSLIFAPAVITKSADGTQIVSYTLAKADGQSIIHQYLIKPNNYMVDWNIILNGANSLLTGNLLNLNWQVQESKQQSDVKYERLQSKIYYVENGSYDYTTAASGASKSFDKPTQWVAVKQQFFNSTLVAKNNFIGGDIAVVVPASDDTSVVVGKATANMKIQLSAASPNVTVPMSFYYGPNDYNLLKSYNLQMENIIDLGSGVFSFVKYINRFIIIPVFAFFAGFISNYGWVIALLTLFIRLVTSPLTYSSYLSGAKMKVLRPELDVLKKKFGEDQQGFAVEQMKLFREAGVNPLGGCIPALLQIPIFFALYSFFNSAIILRGQPFLWAKDLSSYDVFFDLPFSVPFGLGDHISLFMLTAVITSFLISIYNMSMTPDTGNPVMKYMPYIFPFILLFIFNSLPSALTWYYTVSNSITLLLQFVIQNYIINHDKILAKMEETRKKPKVKSKWQQRYDQMMESQKKVQELKQKTDNKR